MPGCTLSSDPGATCEHYWLLISPEHGPYASYGCQQCPATGKGYEIIEAYRISPDEALAEARRTLLESEQAAAGDHAAGDLRSAFRALDSTLSTGDDLPAAWHRPALPTRQALISAIQSVPPSFVMIMPAVEPVADAILASLAACAAASTQPGNEDATEPAGEAAAGQAAPDDEGDGWTVIGVWLSGDPVPVGVIAGNHDVEGGDSEEFPEGLWATHVGAADVAGAEAAAIQEMSDA
jgi:hypothetical protein